MTDHCGGATAPPSEIDLAAHVFAFVEPLLPERDPEDAFTELYPQALYAKRDSARLHKHGHGPFCKFRISVPRGMAGVYPLIVVGNVRYIGECEDLGKRFNIGYGTISPRNCCRWSADESQD